MGRRSKISPAIFIAAILCLLFPFIAGCWIPENFVAKVNVNKDGSYDFTYDGTLAYALALVRAKKGSLSTHDEAELQQEASKIRQEPGFKKVEYLGTGRYKVFFQRSCKPGEPLYFTSSDNTIVSVLRQPDGTVVVAGWRPSKEKLAQLDSIGAKVEGTLSVSVASGVTVVRHNAQTEPTFFGLLGTYKWQINSPGADPVIVVRPPS